ncbi:HCL079Cp [Eremothecium sinecaudum]|uniref:Peroxisomal membrane protein PEX14 n=1 Tax=Eremothecium sinecaudum TaxID=45286 RepID=A0A109UWP1_9SACH|nr:HCL079Cp [Eremothecium sinecaudum]AMD20072.1 HCL079Cp [Eremothecium sinecaudum]
MSEASSEDRSELLASAVQFLAEPSVKEAPLSKKVEFLQKKGLSEQEIEQALKQSETAGSKMSQDVPLRSQVSNSHFRSDDWYEAVPPPLPKRDWKDYFIMATTTVGVCYGLYEFAKRYVVPQLLPEAKSKLEEDKKHIDDHFEKVDKLLETVEQEQEAFREQQAEKLKELDATVLNLQTALEETTKTRNNINFEVRELKLQVGELTKKLEEYKYSREHNNKLAKLESDLESLIKLASTSFSTPNTNGNGIPNNSVLSAASIPTASQILEKMKGKVNSEETQDSNNLSAWKSPNSHTASNTPPAIPEWQKAAMREDSILQSNPSLLDELSQED